MIEVEELELNNYYLLSYKGMPEAGIVIFTEEELKHNILINGISQSKFIRKIIYKRNNTLVANNTFAKRLYSRKNFLLDEFEIKLYEILT